MRHADLRMADLRGADLRGARLVGADFRGVLLNAARLEGAILDWRWSVVALELLRDRLGDAAATSVLADLAFDDEQLKEQATIGVLAGSLTAAVAGVLLLRFLGERFPLCSPGTEGPPTLPPNGPTW